MNADYRGFQIRSAAWLQVAVYDTRVYDLGPVVGYYPSLERACLAIDNHLDRGWPFGGTV